MQNIQGCHNSLFGSSDASFKGGEATHAWTISTGEPNDLLDPLTHSSGSSPVDGIKESLSSSRGEIQGMTTVSIISKSLLDFHNTTASLVLICDNKGAQKKCSYPFGQALHHHRLPNIDLILHFQAQTKSFDVTHLWVKSCQDTLRWDTLQYLLNLDIGRDVIYNVWYQAHRFAVGMPDPDPLPSEKWAVYSAHPTLHKIIRNLYDGIHAGL